MRTTVNLDPDIFRAAKLLAEARSTSLGRALSDLARRGLQHRSADAPKADDFPVFQVREDSPTFGLDDIKREDEQW